MATQPAVVPLVQVATMAAAAEPAMEPVRLRPSLSLHVWATKGAAASAGKPLLVRMFQSAAVETPRASSLEAEMAQVVATAAEGSLI